jgi:hypothetical protein
MVVVRVLEGNVIGQHYWQQLTVAMWKFCVNCTALLATADSGNVEVLGELDSTTGNS